VAEMQPGCDALHPTLLPVLHVVCTRVQGYALYHIVALILLNNLTIGKQDHCAACLFDTRPNDPKKLEQYECEIRIFNSSLLNGGQRYVDSLFEKEVTVLHQQLCEGGELEDIRKQIWDRHHELSTKLNRPTLAIDECHMPLSEATGLLFHSDYKQKKRDHADMLCWHEYELSLGKGKKKAKPSGYPYSGPTTLFSGFRWILQEYLDAAGSYQTAVFTSTFFSVWEPLMDASKYSREKRDILRVYLSYTLSVENMLEVLKQIQNDEVASTTSGKGKEAELGSDETLRNVLSKWCGRPGFFFDRFLRQFKGYPQDRSFRQRIKEADEAARQTLDENVFERALLTLSEAGSVKDDTISVAVTGEQILGFLYYCYRLRGGNINSLSSDLARLVQVGLAVVQVYKAWPKGKSIGFIAEHLVRDFLHRKSVGDKEAGEFCDKYIASLIKTASGTSYGNVAEYGLANRIISSHGQSLQEVLTAWGAEPMPFLHGMCLRAITAASINDILRCNPTDFVDWQLLGEVAAMPRDGIVMPDLSFFASNENGNYCLVTIQSKVTSAKLSNDELNGAIRSTSVHKLFTQKGEPTCTFRVPSFVSSDAVRTHSSIFVFARSPVPAVLDQVARFPSEGQIDELRAGHYLYTGLDRSAKKQRGKTQHQ